MKKKILVMIAVLAVLVLGGIYGMTKWIEHQNSPYNVSDVLDDKGVKLYKRGFGFLEEQLATYIKEHYSGVGKIEFSPIFVQGGNGQTFLVLLLFLCFMIIVAIRLTWVALLERRIFLVLQVMGASNLTLMDLKMRLLKSR